MLKHLKELVALPGVPGQETPVRAYIVNVLNTHGDRVSYTEDALGNLLVRVKGTNSSVHTVMFNAHMDEVGLIVTGVTPEGYLRFATAGGIDEKVLIGRRVRVNGHVGVIGCGAMHLCPKDKRNTPISVDKMYIDIGADNREIAEQVVTVGDAAVFDSVYTPLENHKCLARALDDRAGCALLLALLEEPLTYDVVLAFTVQEELGMRGATTAAFSVQPDISVTVETTTASDIAGTKPGREVCFMGKGAVVSFMDGRTLYDQKLYQRILALAEDHHIAVQPKTVVAGGNDAGAIQTAGHGARVAAVSLPCRYIHSAGSVLSEEDIEQARQLLCVLANVLPGESL